MPLQLPHPTLWTPGVNDTRLSMSKLRQLIEQTQENFEAAQAQIDNARPSDVALTNRVSALETGIRWDRRYGNNGAERFISNAGNFVRPTQTGGGDLGSDLWCVGGHNYEIRWTLTTKSDSANWCSFLGRGAVYDGLGVYRGEVGEARWNAHTQASSDGNGYVTAIGQGAMTVPGGESWRVFPEVRVLGGIGGFLSCGVNYASIHILRVPQASLG